MLAAEAHVHTEHPSRYLTQLVNHASKMSAAMGGHPHRRPSSHGRSDSGPRIQHAEYTGTDGAVTLNWGRWTMHAAPGILTLHAEADSAEDLRRIQDLVSARLEKIGRRDHLTVSWQPAGAEA
jgi:hypothetical protein